MKNGEDETSYNSSPLGAGVTVYEFPGKFSVQMPYCSVKKKKKKKEKTKPKKFIFS